jgi:thiamine-monophosphate kinase
VNRTEINKLGEFGIINKIDSKFNRKRKSTVIGIGDDAAAVSSDKDLVLLSSDMLVEGVHFDLSYTPLKHLGYKSVIVNLSDIYSMNSYPKQIILNIALSNKFSIEAIDEFYEGVKYACDEHNIDLIGGDTTSSLSGLTISCTSIGYCNNNKISKRDGALSEDIICISGDLGRAYLGLLILQREKSNFLNNPQNQPILSDYKDLVEKQLRPKARKDIIDFFDLNNIKPNSMIDISDGLSSELFHIANSSKLGFKIFEEKLPIHKDVIATSKELNVEFLDSVLNGGEEYELLFSLPINSFEKLKIENIDITPLGHFTQNKKKILVLNNGKEINMEAEGWNHF